MNQEEEIAQRRIRNLLGMCDSVTDARKQRRIHGSVAAKDLSK